MVRAGRVAAVRVLVAAVLAGLALVHLDAVELVQPPVAGHALAHVRAERVDAPRVQMAVITIKTTLLSALVNVWDERSRLVRRILLEFWRANSTGRTRFRPPLQSCSKSLPAVDVDEHGSMFWDSQNLVQRRTCAPKLSFGDDWCMGNGADFRLLVAKHVILDGRRFIQNVETFFCSEISCRAVSGLDNLLEKKKTSTGMRLKKKY